MKLKDHYKLVLAVVLTGITGMCLAAPVIDTPETWNASPSVESWKSSGDVATLGNTGSGGSATSPNGYLQITMGVPLSSGKVYADSTSSGGNFAGTGAPAANYYSVLHGGSLNGALQVEFNFIALDNQASGLALYFESAARSWMITLNSPTTGAGWSHFAVDISNFSSWSMMGGGAPSEFLVQQNWINDLSDVRQIGLSILGNLGTGEMYGMDDFELTYYVPEPETVWMILAVVLSLGITFRSRLVDTMSQMKTRFTKV